MPAIRLQPEREVGRVFVLVSRTASAGVSGGRLEAKGEGKASRLFNGAGQHVLHGLTVILVLWALLRGCFLRGQHIQELREGDVEQTSGQWARYVARGHGAAHDGSMGVGVEEAPDDQTLSFSKLGASLVSIRFGPTLVASFAFWARRRWCWNLGLRRCESACHDGVVTWVSLAQEHGRGRVGFSAVTGHRCIH